MKNPDDECLTQMRQVATKLHARVQGDEGEFYEEPTTTPSRPKLTFRNKVAGWFSRFRPARPLKIEHPLLPFGVGDRVRDTWSNECTVTEIDPKAEQGLGVIRTRRDDGTEIGHSMLAHGLTPIKKS